MSAFGGQRQTSHNKSFQVFVNILHKMENLKDQYIIKFSTACVIPKLNE